MKIEVTAEQFDVSDSGCVHRPTGYRFEAQPGFPQSGWIENGKLGAILMSGEFYEPRDVKWVAEVVWAEQLRRMRAKQS